MTNHLLVIDNHAYSRNIHFWNTVKDQDDFEHLTEQFKARILKAKGDQVLAYTEKIVASLIPEIEQRLAVAKTSYRKRLNVKPDLSRQEKSKLTKQANHDCEQLQRYLCDNLLYRKATDLNNDIQRLIADGFDVYLSQMTNNKALFNGVNFNRITDIIKLAQTIIDSQHDKSLHDDTREAFRTNKIALTKLKADIFNKTDHDQKTINAFHNSTVLRCKLGDIDYPTYLAGFDWHSTDNFKQVDL